MDGECQSTDWNAANIAPRPAALAVQYAADFGSQLRPMLLRVLERAARIRILVRPAEHHEERGGAGMGCSSAIWAKPA